MVDFKMLYERVRLLNPKADLDLIKKAYLFSAKAHKHQVRRSGEPYLQHPLEVAYILANDLHMDDVSITVGLLHDIVEDTESEITDIEDVFGSDVASLVDGLTKISKIKFKTREEKQAENFRRMLIYMARDVRVILIKLADRLHNMRTLEYMDHERQLRIAQETKDIYATIANRLGIGWMKTELEDLCLKFLEPQIFHDLVTKVAKRKSVRKSYIKNLEKIVAGLASEFNIPFSVSGRPKSYHSIYQKMKWQGVPFEAIYDLSALRIITDSVMNCYTVLGLLHSKWPPVPGRFKDYIGVPKSNSYQSVHTTVVGPDGEQVEFQIRTKEMHKVAEEGIAAHWKYKEGGVAGNDESLFNWLRQMMEWQKNLQDNKQFMESVKSDLKQIVVYVFTPQGDLMELPVGSTPVDFAYAVHTEIGNRCVGSRVNKKLVPLKTQLRSGDLVEIFTSAKHSPSKDWLKFLKTSKAKNKVKLWLKNEERQKSLEIGKKVFERELRKNKISISEVYKKQNIDKIFKQLHFNSLDDMFYNIGYGRSSVVQIIKVLHPDKQLKENIKDKIVNRLSINRGKVMVSGADDILVHLSKCCSPLPGDKIIGFITRGRGISVHTTSCPNFDELDLSKERLVDVVWSAKSENLFQVKVHIATHDKPGVLAEISACLHSLKVNVHYADVKTGEHQKANFKFLIAVKGIDHLHEVIRRVLKIKAVIEVNRVMQ